MSITIRKAATATILALLSVSLFAAPQTAPTPHPIPLEQPYVKRESLPSVELKILMDPEQDHSAESGSFGKIRAGVMKVKKGIDGKWQISLTVTKPKHLDFVLFGQKKPRRSRRHRA